MRCFTKASRQVRQGRIVRSYCLHSILFFIHILIYVEIVTLIKEMKQKRIQTNIHATEQSDLCKRVCKNKQVEKNYISQKPQPFETVKM